MPRDIIVTYDAGPPNLPPVWDPIISTFELTVGVPIMINLNDYCSDPNGDLLSYAHISGTLPSGLSLNMVQDLIEGTPTTVQNPTATIRASDGQAYADASLTFNVLAADTTAPVSPILSGIVVSSSANRLSWTPVTDPVVAGARTSGVNNYRLFRNGLFLKNVGNVLTYDDINLPPNATYNYRCKAVDAAGNASEPWSNEVSLTTSIVRRFRPGHWSHIQRGQRDQQSRNTMLARTVSGVTKGWMKRYTWRQLEPTQGNYSFLSDPNHELLLDLQWATANGLAFLPMIEDKTFVEEYPGPDYMLGYTIPQSGGGYVMARWDPFFVTRWNALITALAPLAVTYPCLEGFGMQETSGSSMTTPPGPGDDYIEYTVNGYRDAMIEMILHAATTIPQCRFFWHFNFMPAQNSGVALDEVITATYPSDGVVVGGPDVLPNSQPLINRAYWMYDKHKDNVPLMCHAQNDSYRHVKPSGGYYSMEEIFLFGRDSLFLNYFFWTMIGTASPADSHNYDDAVPVMNEYPTFNTETW